MSRLSAVQPHGRTLRALIEDARESVELVTPYVTRYAADLILSAWSGAVPMRLISRLNDQDILSGAIDLEGLARLVDAGVAVRFADRALHAKLWMADGSAHLGSANLTRAGLTSNVELVLRLDLAESAAAHIWFEEAWKEAEPNSWTSRQLLALKARLANHPVAFHHRKVRESPSMDYGVKSMPSGAHSNFGRPVGRTWFRLGGTAEERFPPSWDLERQAMFDGAQTFGPKPSLGQGDVVYLALTSTRSDGSHDRCIYGRAIVDVPYVAGSGDLPDWVLTRIPDAEARAEVSRWPHVLWVRDLQVVRGTLENSVWLDDHLEAGTVRFREQRSYFEMDAREAKQAADMLEARFQRHGVIQHPRPDLIWWNHHIPNSDNWVNRAMLRGD